MIAIFILIIKATHQIGKTGAYFYLVKLIDAAVTNKVTQEISLPVVYPNGTRRESVESTITVHSLMLRYKVIVCFTFVNCSTNHFHRASLLNL